LHGTPGADTRDFVASPSTVVIDIASDAILRVFETCHTLGSSGLLIGRGSRDDGGGIGSVHGIGREKDEKKPSGWGKAWFAW